MKKNINGFGIQLCQMDSRTLILFWSLRLTHLLHVLGEQLMDRHVIVYTGHAYGGFGKAVLSLSEMMTWRRVPHKKLRSGCVSIRGDRFSAAEIRIRRDLACGPFEFIDAIREPPYKIFQNFRKSAIQFVTAKAPSTVVAKIPVELGSSFNCHLRDNDMGAIAVRNRDESRVTIGCLEEMFRREWRRLTIPQEPPLEKFSPMSLTIWLRFRGLLLQHGITVIRKDIHLNKTTLVAPCWLGYPERDQQFDKVFLLKYSLSKGKWSIGPVTSVKYPYGSLRINTGWRLPDRRVPS